jgi:ribosomal protein L29
MSKKQTYHDTPAKEIEAKLEQSKKRLSELRLELRLQKMTSHSEIRKTRKDIARMLTAQNSSVPAKEQKNA